MLLQSPSQTIPLPQRHTSHETNRNSSDKYRSQFYTFKESGMADGNDSVDTMMLEHETRTKLSSPPASSTPPSPSSPKSSIADDKTENKINPDHNGNAASEDSIVKEKSHAKESKKIPTTESMSATNAASLSFQTLMSALGSLPPTMAPAAFQALASMSTGAGSSIPPAVLAALPPEFATIMQQFGGLSNSPSSHPQNLSSPSSQGSDTVSTYAGDQPNSERPYQNKTNNNNDISVMQSSPLSREKINVSEDCEDPSESEAAPDTPPSSIPGRCQEIFFLNLERNLERSKDYFGEIYILSKTSS